MDSARMGVEDCKIANGSSGISEPSKGIHGLTVTSGRMKDPSSQGLTDSSTDGSPTFAINCRTLFARHWHSTITYCAVFWSFGMCVAFLGPTLLDLGCLTSSDVQTMSWVFFVQLLCTLVGATVAGYLVQRKVITVSVDECRANYLLLAATIVIPLTMMVLPLFSALVGLAITLALMGLSMGSIDSLANLQMMHIYGDAVSPFLQALHFCYGVGAFVSPMIAEPFLLNEDCSYFVDNITMPTPAPNKTYDLPANTLEEAQEMTRVRYAFWIMAALQIPVVLLVLSLVFKLRLRGWQPGHRPLVESESESNVSLSSMGKQSDYQSMDRDSAEQPPLASLQPGEWYSSRTGLLVAITGATAALAFIYDGLQSTYGGYVYTYAVKSIVDLNKTEGAYLNAAFWGMFSLGRLLSIFIATRIRPAFMLMCNIAGCTFAMVLMLSLRHDHIALYVGTCIFGLFLSSVTPTALALAEHYIDFHATVTTAIVVIAAIGEMICPVVVGNLFVTVGPVSFLAFGTIMCFLSIGVFLGLVYLGWKTPKEQAHSSLSWVWCAAVCCWRAQPPDPAAEEGTLVTRHVRYYTTQMSDSSSNIELSSIPQQQQQQQQQQQYQHQADGVPRENGTAYKY